MWMQQHLMCSNLTKDATAYIWYWIQKNHFDPFGYFYLTVKIHKGPLSTRPVCSDCASLVHPPGKWLNYMLQPIVACQPIYFKDSFLLKQVLPPNASIITFDAITMYTNIDINDSIDQITNFLSEIWDKYDCKAVEEAMNISTTKDLSMMDLPSGCMTTTLQPTQLTGNFKNICNAMGLSWTFKSPPKKLIFMDMTLRFEGERLVTTIYAKPMALYQYIWPNPCHPLRVLTSLIFGQIFWIYQLCSLSQDINKELSLFYKHLLNRGYTSTNLLPLFKKGINNAISYLSHSLEQQEARKKAKVGQLDEQIFLHLPYHPQNPSSRFIQSLWQNLIFSLPGQEELTKMTNHKGHHVPIKRLIVAYHPNPNLANLNSYRKLSMRTRLKPSTFIIQAT